MGYPCNQIIESILKNSLLDLQNKIGCASNKCGMAEQLFPRPRSAR